MNPLIELLSPAGSVECLYAAAENGADAVYFGIAGSNKDNYNARARAQNIPLHQLGEMIVFLHRRGLKGYITLNTLVRHEELSEVESLLKEIVAAQADAVILQDFGVAQLAHRLCPDLPIHASTQMSLTSQREIELAQTLGLHRVVLPRELSLRQIRELRQKTNVELECFVHGALCISFSGQCYASLGLGGRSANRGRCAQPCRLAYSLMSPAASQHAKHTEERLLSPCDFAALPLLPQLMATGVHALKIEGRLKQPEYVAEVTRIYRNEIDKVRI
jgi:putative protease